MKQILAALLLVFCLFGAQAQEAEKKVRWMGKFEGRNAFVRTHHALFLGLRAGVELKFPIRLGVGYYWMQSNIPSQLYDASEYPLAGTTAQPRMRYAIAYAEYTFWREDDWSLSVPVQMGFGETFYRTNKDERVASGFVMPLEAGVDVGYMFARWAGIGVGLGYRVMVVNNDKVKENFNSPYYQVRINLVLNEIFKKKKG